MRGKRKRRSKRNPKPGVIGGWWGRHGDAVITGVIVAAASTVVTFFIMRALEKNVPKITAAGT